MSEHDVPDWAAVGEDMVKRRYALNKMTQEELHVAARVSIFVISEIEKGVIRNRAPGTLARLSEALHCPANHLDDILYRRTTPGRAPPEQAADDLTADKQDSRSIGEKLDILNGKLDALLKHYDIVWQPSPPAGISVELAGHGHGHELPKTEDDGSSSLADE